MILRERNASGGHTVPGGSFLLKFRAKVEFLVEFFGGRRQDQQRSRQRKNPEVLEIQGFPGGGDWRARTVDLMRVNYFRLCFLVFFGNA